MLYLSLGSDGLVFEDVGVVSVRVLAAQLPHLKEGLPTKHKPQTADATQIMRSPPSPPEYC